MKSLFALLLLPFALIACSKDGGGNSTAATAPAGSVAAVAPPSGQAWTDVVAKTAEGYRVGNPDAKIKLVEYGSRLCPACGNLARTGYQPLMDGYVKTGKVSLEFREFLVHGAADFPPALLGYCVEPGAFFPLLEAMYADQQQFNDRLMKLTPAQQQQLQRATPAQAIGMLADAEGIVPWVQQRGIPEAKARQCLADKAVIDRLTKQTQDRGADGTVTGTPTLLIGTDKIDALSWPDLEKALKARGA